jgi:hypothetical protein
VPFLDYIFVNIDMVILQLRTHVSDILVYLYLGGSMLTVFFSGLWKGWRRDGFPTATRD